MSGYSRPAETVLALAGLVVIFAGIKYAETIVVPFVLALFLATIAAGPVSWLRSKRIPNAIAISMVVAGLVLVLAGFAALFTNAANDFADRQDDYQLRVSELMERSDQLLSRLDFLCPDDEGDGATSKPGSSCLFEAVEEAFDPSRALSFLNEALAHLVALISNGFLVGLAVVFILAEGSSLPERLKRVLQQRRGAFLWLDQFSHTLYRYLAVKTCVSLATGLLVGTYLAILDVDFFELWGLLAFLLNYIPNIGSVLAAIPAVLVAIVQPDGGNPIAVVLGFVAVNVLMGAFVEPKYMGRVMGLSTLVVFLSLALWGWLLGPVGMLLSVPLTMAVKLATESSPSTVWIASLLGPIDKEPRTSGHEVSPDAEGKEP